MRWWLVLLGVAMGAAQASVAQAASPWDGEWEGSVVQRQLPCSPCRIRMSINDGIPNIRGEISIPHFDIDSRGQVTGSVAMNAADYNSECTISGRISANSLVAHGRCTGNTYLMQLTLRRVTSTAGGSQSGKTGSTLGGNYGAPPTTPPSGVTPRGTGPSLRYGDDDPVRRGPANRDYDDDDDGSLRQQGADNRSPPGPGTTTIPNDRGKDRGTTDRNPGNKSDNADRGNSGNSGQPIQLPPVAQLKGVIVDNMKGVLPGVVEIHPKNGIGSGFVIDAAAGLILTNYHVVGTAATVTVVFGENEEVVGTVLRRDQGRDVALIKVQKKNIIALPIRLSEVIPAEKAYAIGSPFGMTRTVSEGIISSFRKLEGKDFIQATPAISPGNSGGPLLDGSGNVIGISVLILTPGIGTDFRFFIPIGAALSTLNIKPAAQ